MDRFLRCRTSLRCVMAALIALLIFSLAGCGFFQRITMKSGRQPVPKPAVPSLTIVASGDIMLGRHVALTMGSNRGYPYELVKSYLKAGDLTFGNLECVLSTQGTPLLGKGIWLRSDPRSAQYLKQAGYSILSVANNHTLDYGSAAFLDTINALQGQGIASLGGGRDLNSAIAPLVLKSHGYKVGFLASTEMADIFWSYKTRRTLEAKPDQPGVAKLNEARLVKQIQDLKGKVDLIVVSLHWGTEYSDYQTPQQQQIAHHLVDAGANLIFGTHPHALQGVESYHGALIAYSLGNFIYDKQTRPKSQEGILMKVNFEKKTIKEVTFYPTLILQERPHIATGSGAARILGRASSLSKQLGTTLNIHNQTATVVLNQ
jgi:poly-gamma-glutamate capsule biosynthesis protein CapA/YwtB (metallophosphatase superfamily)